MMKRSKISAFFNFMRTRIKEVRKLVPIIFILTTVLSVVSFLVAILSKNLLDHLISNNGTFDITIIILLILIVCQVVFNYSLSIINALFVDKYKYRIQLYFYKNILNSNYLYNSIISSSDVYYRMFTDVTTMVNFYVHLIIKMPLNFIILIASTIVLIIWNPILLCFYYLLVFIQIIVILSFKNKIKQNYKSLKQKEEAYIQNINENTQRIDIIKSLDLVEYCSQDTEIFFKDYLKQDIKSTIINGGHINIISLIGQFWNIGILFMGIHFVISGKLTLGTLFGFSMLSSILSNAISEFISLISNYQNAIVSFERIKEFEQNQGNHIKEKRNFSFTSNLELQNLVFSYGENTVLYKSNFVFKKDNIYFIQGKNGCGKTTLCRLISKFLRPESGQILIDSINLDFFNENDFRNNVIYINSEPMIFNKSIYENITLNKKFSNTDVTSVIDICGLSTVVQKHGLHTNLGLSEGNLSLGEKQKIALARAIIRRPKILILDEPTAHVDEQSTVDIIKMIQKYQVSYGSLIIICSHDLRLKKITKNVIDFTSLMNSNESVV